MTFRDLITISFGNLFRMKLRTFLTVSGIIIAIAAFVSMLSFGAGNQQLIEDKFNNLGLFTTMQVYPKSIQSDSSTQMKLDAAALDRIATIPGVRLIYPYNAFTVTLKICDTMITSRAQALPSTAMRTKLFSTLIAGNTFDSNSSRQVIISDELVRTLHQSSPDSLIGQRLIISVHASVIDSGLSHILVDTGMTIWQRAKKIHYDSLWNAKYRQQTIRTEMNEVARRFISGFLNAQTTVSDTLVICGVQETGRMGRLHIDPVIIPLETATHFSSSGFRGDPSEIMSALTTGSLFASPDAIVANTYSQATVDFDPKVPYKTVQDSIEALGFRTFSFAAQFEEIQRAFLYFDMALGLIGLIALTTASLGIVNTMVMSITERRREIGILKSLGADDLDVRRLFLVESAVLGLIGTLGGIVFGWIIARIGSAVAQVFMKKEGIPAVDLFSTPPWLVLIAIGIGVGISIVAGYYPAARASRVDPIEALRNE